MKILRLYLSDKILPCRKIVVLVCLLWCSYANGQSVFTSTINATGGAKKVSQIDLRFPNYSFEWSVGESTIITNNNSLNLQVSHGVLQGFLLNNPLVPAIGSWFPDELKIYPNPVVRDFNIELLSNLKGEVVFTLYNNNGLMLFQKTINYQGAGRSESFNISYLPSGTYVLNVKLNAFSENRSFILKQGGFKIIKIR